MLLYHFATAENAQSIKKQGLTKGVLMWPLCDGRYMKVRPMQWLTIDADPARQHWATNRTGDCGNRLEARVVLEIPRLDPGLHRWNEWALWTLHASQIDILEFAAAGNCSGADWYVYIGRIPRERVIAVHMIGAECPL